MRFASASLFLIFAFNLSSVVLSCRTTEVRKEHLILANSSEDIAIFSVSNEVLSSILPHNIYLLNSIFSEQIEISPILKRVDYRLSILSSEDWNALLEPNTLAKLDEMLSESIQKNPSGAYLILVKKDDPLSPLTKILRTSILYIKTVNGEVIIIPDLRQNITFASQYKFDDWSIYTLEKVKTSYKQDLRVKSKGTPMSFYIEKSADKISVYGRVIIHKEIELLPKPILLRVPDEEEINTIKSDWQSVPDRIKILDDLRKKKLINEEEYQNKKKQLLDEL
ncbi:SHOCT domain-containing protein [Leptospira ilyithenensis]|uniref:SHOCT domain-containing protein n=1 Tax=Leptospira ilyithenensis TaxID=2484901 RepID=A0A4R9LPK0_9LEPT|nr:SHOCT domain-containing protein [Leptospira ilyithenensis]TGN11004.1 SHOCT domain-containing protein [Leptospira ilyithenensis]